uniref:ankyrin repeat domain-containing protein SOWAHB n=1 Tax=Euleptes europaea TaxID=460621 RepID=UPI00254042FC|nr:ankyrin repeat domain-containing protein SOWAHB [Euleptes europaea]
MARELSQAALLEFLCGSGGRAGNAALLGHFGRFLRDPEAGAEELGRRRERFKGFVNAVATVRREGPGAAKAVVVLRRRYRELVGEEPGTPGAAPEPPDTLDVPGRRAQRLGPGGERPGHRAEEAGERPARRTCSPARELRAGPGPASPAPVRATGAPPSGDGGPLLQQRVHAWVASAREVALRPDCAFEGGPARPSPPGSAHSTCPSPALDSPERRASPLGSAHGSCPSPSLDSQLRRPPGLEEWPEHHLRSAHSSCPSPSLDSRLGPPPGLEEWREHHLVFRSIRCQLSLQDLDEFLEQESPASEDGSSSSASGGSDSCRGEAEAESLPRPPPGGPNGCLGNPLGVGRNDVGKSLSGKPRANGLVGLSAGARGPLPGGPVPGRQALPGQRTWGSSSEDKLLDKDGQRPSGQSPKLQKGTRQPPPNLDAPLSPHLAPRQGLPNSAPAVEGSIPDGDGSPEHRSSLVPLEPREHAWLVKVAAGSWLQVRALFLEDPLLATHKDFISGFTVLHWLAKHGNTQVLLDLVTGAQRAGVALDINVRSGCGYTPLHLAAIHGHQPVIRLLVQKLRCQVQVRDGSGKRPWQYLSSSTSGEIWQLLGAPKGKTIFPARPIARNASLPRRGKSPELARKISRKTSLAAYLKPQHIKWKMANKYPALQEREEDSD